MNNDQMASLISLATKLLVIGMILSALFFPLVQTEVTVTETPVEDYSGEYVSEQELSESRQDEIRQEIQNTPFYSPGVFISPLDGESYELNEIVYTFTEGDKFINLWIHQIDLVYGIVITGVCFLSSILLFSAVMIYGSAGTEHEHTMRM